MKGEWSMTESEKPEKSKKKLNRREFLVGSGAALAAGAIAAGVPGTAKAAAKESLPKSEGYIVYDSRVCWGCQSCMFACSMAHYGEANPTLSRIQIIRDAPSFTTYPNDIVMAVCRQCITPVCVENCPTGAAHVDTEHGNVRVIDTKKCIGCKKCIQMCPQRPHRTVWNPIIKKSTKCDLCIDTPFWSKKGGPDGEPACVTNCPAKALKLVHETPSQEDTRGYDVDLAPPAPKMPFGPGAKKPPAPKS
jgi:Fe-S-cluster-containing dehydrogenase component